MLESKTAKLVRDNVFECPHCGYHFLFPSAFDYYHCPVCAGKVTRGK